MTAPPMATLLAAAKANGIAVPIHESNHSNDKKSQENRYNDGDRDVG